MQIVKHTASIFGSGVLKSKGSPGWNYAGSCRHWGGPVLGLSVGFCNSLCGRTTETATVAQPEESANSNSKHFVLTQHTPMWGTHRGPFHSSDWPRILACRDLPQKAEGKLCWLQIRCQLIRWHARKINKIAVDFLDACGSCLDHRNLESLDNYRMVQSIT